MYRQIWIDPRDRDYQRIIWNNRDYQLNTVTYGTVSAPYLALRVMKQLVENEGRSHPTASTILQNNTYVDDVLFGSDDVATTREIRRQICDLLARGGFELRKWASNEPSLLTDIPTENHGLACDKHIQSNEILTVLGIFWQIDTDSFQFQVSLPPKNPRTKRSILSMIAKLFDPLGWVTPVIISAKIFMQTLWRLHLDWDDDLPPSSFDQWSSIYEALPQLNNIKIPRWTGLNVQVNTYELHGFSDASTGAYAAAVYLRSILRGGEISINLLAGKSKVAPVKPLTVPRLELSASLLLARLIDFITTSLNLKPNSCYCWTDSAVTLAWINSHPSRWKSFVAHRVEEIQNLLPKAK